MSIIYAKKILIPLDFSPDSRLAVNEGLALANRLGAQVTLLHVIHDSLEDPGFYLDGKKLKKQKKIFQQIDDAAVEKLNEFVEKDGIDKQAKELGVTLDLRCRRGIPVTQIVRLAEKKEYGLIVMGSSGRTGLSHILLGSVAERVVERSTVPVMVVKKTKKR
ncbi:MAG: universal stress protein [Magnetococcales bacterium]|nr:universal stress protein [Magnetococcales bacterium]